MVDVARHARHISLPNVGVEGQRKLNKASVLVIGAGGLGSPAALYLVAAGIGRLGLVDNDEVDLSNLQRQILHTTDDVGLAKVASAKATLEALDPNVKVEVFRQRLNPENAMDIMTGWDIVIDGTDNLPTRYLIDDACALLGLPWVYGSVFRFEGQVSLFNHDGGPCYRDLFPEPPPPGGHSVLLGGRCLWGSSWCNRGAPSDRGDQISARLAGLLNWKTPPLRCPIHGF